MRRTFKLIADETTINEILGGKRDISKTIAARLAAFFRVTLNDFIIPVVCSALAANIICRVPSPHGFDLFGDQSRQITWR